MFGEFDHKFSRDVVSRCLRKVVDDHRQRRAVAHKAIKRQHVCWIRHLAFVVMRRAHHRNVVAQLGGVLGQPQGFDGRLDPGASDQHFFVRSRFAGTLQYLAALFIAEQDGFASRAKHDNANHRRTRIVLDILFELAEVNFAVGIKRSGNGRKDSV